MCLIIGNMLDKKVNIKEAFFPLSNNISVPTVLRSNINDEMR